MDVKTHNRSLNQGTARHLLSAGEVRALLAGPDLRYVRAGSVEAIRRVYVGVRDAGWGTVEPVMHNLRVEQDARSFKATFDVEHVAGDVSFAWRGTVSGRAESLDETVDCRLRFEMDGIARTTFRTSRTGICLLHPIVRSSDRSCDIEHADGSRESSHFPLAIAPHQPFTNIRATTHRPSPELRATVTFEGEVFETEDQRNWSDSSFKTYCRPLSRPFPYVLERGERVVQAVTIHLQGRSRPEQPAVIRLDTDAGAEAVPAIGTRLTTLPLSETERALLRQMRPAHLRIDLFPGQPEWESAATGLLDQAAQLDIPVELGLHLTPGQGSREATLAAALLHRRQQTLCRVIVYETGQPVASAELAAAVGRDWQDILRGAPIGVGTIGAFTEMNRHRPTQGSVELIAFPVNPQVHSTDDLSLVENVEAQRDTVATARQQVLGGAGSIAVGPVTLARRPDPFAAGASGVETSGPTPDPRQAGLLGAAWTVASIAHLHQADSITYLDANAAFGILPEGGAALLYHVLADIGAFSDGQLLPCTTCDPLRYAAILLRRGDKAQLLVANLLDSDQGVALQGLERYRVTGRLELSAGTAAVAAGNPERFRGESRLPERRLPARLDLSPFAVVRLDLEEGTV